MPTQDDLLFGRIAVKNRILDEVKLKKCLALLEQATNAPPLGKFLLEKGLISDEQFRAVSAHLRKVRENEGVESASPASESAVPAAATAARSVGGQGGGSAQRSAGPATLARTAGSLSSVSSESRVYRASDIAAMDFSRLAGKPIDDYLSTLRKLGVSDFHFQVDSPPFVRIHGEIVYLRHPKLESESTSPRIHEILDDVGRALLEKTNDYDFCYVAPHGRYRMSAFRQRKGIDAVFRIIPGSVPTIESLHLPETLRKFTKYRQGIVLITGPAGSGKTSTMAALVDLINREQRDHIVTVEDPIEFVIPSQGCNVNQRQVRRDTDNYATALRSAMRSDPDYICVGEMRDLETVSMAITAAETGHLVFATLHTTNAVRSVDRIIDIFPPKEQEQIRAMVSESLRGVISQILVPREDGLGREPSLEILFVTPAVANLIREKKTFQLSSVLQTGSKQGMVTMDESLLELRRQGVISRETARYYAYQKERFA
jgi:twitching motility protein PilT